VTSECFVGFLSPWYQTLVRFITTVGEKMFVGLFLIESMAVTEL